MVSFLDSQLLEKARDQKQKGYIASFENYTFVLYVNFFQGSKGKLQHLIQSVFFRWRGMHN